MSGGPRQLFDPEALPEATAPDRPTASGEDESEDRRGVHSIGGVYQQVEGAGAGTRPFPAIATSGSTAKSSTCPTIARGSAYMSLVDPEDEGGRQGEIAPGVACPPST